MNSASDLMVLTFHAKPQTVTNFKLKNTNYRFSDLDLPPPEPTEVNVMGNSGAAQLYWKPPIPVHLIETVPDFNGYMIHYRTGNASEHLLFTEGHKQNSELLSSLQHGSEYSVYLTSHSAKKKDSPLMSKTIFIKVPALKQEPLPEKPSDHDKVKGKRIIGYTCQFAIF